MNILVSQGHEYGIGLEVFLKAFLVARKEIQNSCQLFVEKKSLLRTLKSSNLDFEINSHELNINGSILKLSILGNSKLPISSNSLLTCFKNIKTNDCLFTLPTSKDQFANPESPSLKFLGHTEFLRDYYKRNLLMCFIEDNLNILLLSDHISLKDVFSTINSEIITNKMIVASRCLPKVKNFIFSGLNPHAGENGLLGFEDDEISKAIKNLSKLLKNKNFLGPFSSDSLLVNKVESNNLYIYCYHDQGLGSFKTLKHFRGINLTLGLPFLRLSVDHGTGFDIYGKNIADYQGAYYCLNKAYEFMGEKSGFYSNIKS
jgi:4-hydroxythreonine-4-phosphate dehydrogenase